MNCIYVFDDIICKVDKLFNDFMLTFFVSNLKFFQWEQFFILFLLNLFGLYMGKDHFNAF